MGHCLLGFSLGVPNSQTLGGPIISAIMTPNNSEICDRSSNQFCELKFA